jgi:hypothetical protein
LDGCVLDHGEVVRRQLLAALGAAAVLFEPSDQPLNLVAFAAGPPVCQRARPVVARLGDDAGDAPAAQPVAAAPLR